MTFERSFEAKSGSLDSMNIGFAMCLISTINFNTLQQTRRSFISPTTHMCTRSSLTGWTQRRQISATCRNCSSSAKEHASGPKGLTVGSGLIVRAKALTYQP